MDSYKQVYVKTYKSCIFEAMTISRICWPSWSAVCNAAVCNQILVAILLGNVRLLLVCLSWPRSDILECGVDCRLHTSLSGQQIVTFNLIILVRQTIQSFCYKQASWLLHFAPGSVSSLPLHPIATKYLIYYNLIIILLFSCLRVFAFIAVKSCVFTCLFPHLLLSI